MQLIKNAIVYKATLPAAAALADHLAERPFEPILETLLSSDGFIPVLEGKLVAEIPGGLSFTLRRDEKILPKKAVDAAIAEEVKRVEAELSEQAGEPAFVTGDDYRALHERVQLELVKKALHATTVTTCYYYEASRLLIIPTTSKDLASRIVSALVQACGAVETATIHVSDVKGGLTTRLRNYFEEGLAGAFEGFTLGDSVVMKGEAGKATFDLENLDHARQGVLEALAGDLVAERLALVRNDAVLFRLTHQFQLRRIQFLNEPSDEELEEQADWDFPKIWSHTAGVQLALVADVVQALCDLFGYQEKPKGEPAAPQDAA